MKSIILDTNILIQWPGIAARRKNGVQFVITSSSLLELTEFMMIRAEGKSLLDILNESIEAGITIIRPNPARPIEKRNIPLSQVDFDIATAALEIVKQGGEAAIASEDNHLLQYARRLGVKTFTLKDLKNELEQEAETNEKIDKKASIVVAAQTRSIVVGLVSGIFISLAVAFIWVNFPFIIKTIQIWGLIVCLVIMSVVLFWFRGHNRFAYGIAEVLVGLVTGVLIFHPDYDLAKITGKSFFQILAALYVMVRGLDNVGKSLCGTRYLNVWRNFFKDQ